MEFRREGEGYSHPPPPIRESAFTRPLPSFVSSSPSILSPRGAPLPPRNGVGPATANSPIHLPKDPDPAPPSTVFPPNAAHKPAATATSNSSSAAATPDADTVRYHECLRNHAAAIGGHVLDGCGEFMPGGGGGDDPMKCAACGCHRSFHRREAGEGELVPFYHRLHNGNVHQPRVPLLPAPPPLSHHHHHHHRFPPSPPAIAASGGTTTESSSEELNAGATAGAVVATTTPLSKKRFRTKFTPEQKRLMMQFAESVDWRIQKQHDASMEQFCSEIGISRQVLKVWMHNHKHAIRKPHLLEQQQEPQHPQHLHQHPEEP